MFLLALGAKDLRDSIKNAESRATKAVEELAALKGELAALRGKIEAMESKVNDL